MQEVVWVIYLKNFTEGQNERKINHFRGMEFSKVFLDRVVVT